MPMPGEVDGAARTDGAFVGDGHVVRLDGRGASLDGSEATWSVEAGVVRLDTPAWSAEGRVGVDDLYLLASPAGDHRAREAWILTFVEDPRETPDSPAT